jgi:hypothetical protein
MQDVTRLMLYFARVALPMQQSKLSFAEHWPVSSLPYGSHSLMITTCNYRMSGRIIAQVVLFSRSL